MGLDDIIYIDWETRRVWVNRKRWRVHHGPFGLVTGGLLCLWGLTDLRDWKDWFRGGPQL